MKRLPLLLILIFSILGNVNGQGPLQAYMSYSTFESPVDGPFVEVYLAVNGQSVKWIQQENDKFMATVEVTYVFSQDSNIVNFSKFNLNSAEVADTSLLLFNIIGQERISLKSGEYAFDVTIRDLNTEDKAYHVVDSLEIGFPEKGIAFSGIEFVKSFTKVSESGPITKSGFDVVPYVFSFFPESETVLRTYSELYHTDRELGDGNGFLVKTYLQSYEKGGQVPGTVQNRRMKAMPVNVIMNEIDISNLPSGNFYHVIEVRNRDNELVGVNRQFFQRSNPEVEFDAGSLASLNVGNTFADRFTEIDTLAFCIRSLAPIATEIEKIYASNGLNTGDLEIMKRYFYSFWETRNPADPGKGWELYRQRLILADRLYGTSIKPGFETDRGRVFLQYGPPNTISKQHNEPSAYPYEIWHYYTLQNQSNKKFVFYLPDLVTNDFELIHSDALGEIYNPQWQTLLFRRDTPINNIDDSGDRDQWGNRSRRYFNNPY